MAFAVLPENDAKSSDSIRLFLESFYQTKKDFTFEHGDYYGGPKFHDIIKFAISQGFKDEVQVVCYETMPQKGVPYIGCCLHHEKKFP